MLCATGFQPVKHFGSGGPCPLDMGETMTRDG